MKRSFLVMLAFTSFLAGCSAGPDESGAERTPPASSQTSSSPAPTGIAVTPEQFADADPCGLVDTETLSAYGTVEPSQGRTFHECDVKVRKGDYTATMRYTKIVKLTNYASPPEASDHGGVTVYNYGAPENAGCKREIQVFDEALIEVWLSQTPSDISCEIGDVAIDGTLGKLARGDLPPAGWPPNSLARQNACGLVDAGQAGRVPGTDMTLLHHAYGDESCTWGQESITEPGLYVAFSRDAAPAVDRPVDRETTIAGRRAVVAPRPQDDDIEWLGPSRASCQVTVEHRAAEVPGMVEQLTVSVRADGPEESLCPLAIELATQAANRLPPG